MTTDDGLHLLGTKVIHLVPPLAIGFVGVLAKSNLTVAFAVGMIVVLLFGNMRTVKTYRWRVHQDTENDGK